MVEVNEAAVPSSWPGDVWSFTTREYLVVDDMESYTNDDGSRIYETWIDGYADNSSGSIVGYIEAPFAEQTIIHGGKQSMPFEYNNVNTPFYSEAYREFSPVQNWTVSGADTLGSVGAGATRGLWNDAGNITMSAAGHDIWDNADDFRFALKTLTGNGSIVVKVESLVNTNGWAKAGVMIRESLDADSKFVYFVIVLRHGVPWAGVHRRRARCSSVTQARAIAPLPEWVKLTRTGDVFTAQYSADGKAWTDPEESDGTVASTTLVMTNPVYIGLCVTSHNSRRRPRRRRCRAWQSRGRSAAPGRWRTIGDDPQPANDPSPFTSPSRTARARPPRRRTRRGGHRGRTGPSGRFR